MMAHLRLDLDDLFNCLYFYTDYDIGREGHAITIQDWDKERFTDAFTAKFRQEIECRLVVEETE